MTTTPTKPSNVPESPVSPGNEPAPPYPHKPAAVHRCGREFFRALSRRSRAPETVKSEGDEQHETHVVRLKMQARLLVNVLLIMRKRLVCFQVNDSATKQDVQHCRLLLKDVWTRWSQDGEFAACLRPVDPQMQLLCSKLYHECMGEYII